IPAPLMVAEKRSLKPETVDPIAARPRTAQLLRSVPVRSVVAGALFLLSIVFVFKSIGNRARPAEPAQTDAKVEKEKALTASTGSFELLVVPVQGVEMAVDEASPRPVTETIDLPPGLHKLVFTAPRYSPMTISETIVAGERRVLPVVLSPVAAMTTVAAI